MPRRDNRRAIVTEILEPKIQNQPSSRISSNAFEMPRSVAGGAVSIFDFSR
jgi:hypothetical protein